MPALSVVIPTYNASRYLVQVLQAIVDQSFHPLEVIVVDDGSTDSSVDVVEDFRRRASNVRLLRHERNLGVASAVHHGLQAAVGDYVYFASTSDRVLPGLFEQSMMLLTRHPQAALSCSDFVAFYSGGPQIAYRIGWARDPSFLSPQDLARAIRQKGGYIPGATAIVKRSILLEAGGFNAKLKGHSDWFASLVAGFRHGVCYAPELLAAFRMGLPGSVSTTHRRWTTQRDVLKHLFSLLQSREYQDVAPLFQSSAALACLPHILRALLGQSKYWRYLSSGLISHALRNELRRTLVSVTPLQVKDRLLRLRRLFRIEEPTVTVD